MQIFIFGAINIFIGQSAKTISKTIKPSNIHEKLFKKRFP